MPNVHVKASVYGRGLGINTITTLRFAIAPLEVPGKQALANEIDVYWCDMWKRVAHSGFQYHTIVIVNTNSPNDSPYQQSINRVGVSVPGPPQISLQVNFLTGTAGRRGRGRVYIPGIQTAAFSGTGSFSPTTNENTIIPLLNTLRGRWCVPNSSPYILGVYSRLDDAIRPVVSIQYNTIFAALRSRKPGIGI